MENQAIFTYVKYVVMLGLSWRSKRYNNIYVYFSTFEGIIILKIVDFIILSYLVFSCIGQHLSSDDLKSVFVQFVYKYIHLAFIDLCLRISVVVARRRRGSLSTSCVSRRVSRHGPMARLHAVWLGMEYLLKLPRSETVK